MKRDPDNYLNRSTPEAQGVCSEGILAFLDGVNAASIKMHSLMLVRHGQVVAEGWWQPFTPDCKTYVYSLSKSFTSSAIGFALAEGLLTVEDKVVSFFPDDLPETISDNLAAMCVKDLLTMTTGHATDSLMVIFTPGTENWVQAILAVPVDYTPGTHFLYDTGATYLLSAIVQQLTGQTLLDYLTPRLFQPLGIVDITWDSCPRGINTGGWGLSIRTEDIAKFGVLYAQQGQWQGEQLLPAEWVQEATSFQVPNDQGERASEPIDWRQGYGYQFWRAQHNAYRGDGAFGQYCLVMPDQDAVLVMTSETGVMQAILDLVWAHILPAMHPESLSEQSETNQRLKERLASLQVATPTAAAHSPQAAAVSGKTFKINPNQTGIAAVSFDFDDSGCHFQLEDSNGKNIIHCGSGEWCRNSCQFTFMKANMIQLGLNQPLDAPARVAAVVNWADPRTFVITWQYLETPHVETVTCTFEGETVSLVLGSSLVAPDDPRFVQLEKQFTGRLELNH